MRTLVALFTCLLSLAGALQGGVSQTYKDEGASNEAPASWYSSGEFNVQVWGAYAFTSNEYNLVDRYLAVDHAWGGGLDLRYFLNRYFAVGASGYVLSANQSFSFQTEFFGVRDDVTLRNHATIGAGLATVTLRYPIGGSRFAPYAYAGIGAITGGGQHLESEFIELLGMPAGTNPIRTYVSEGGSTEAVGQIGGGLEIRLTPRVGIINDFNWNIVNGRTNNFGMMRSGLNVAF